MNFSPRTDLASESRDLWQRSAAATAALPDEAPWQPCFRRGTLFGVYAFLERFAGVRMYFPGELGTCVPRAERIIVPEGRVEESPAFSVRRYGYEDGSVSRELLDDLVGRDAPIAPPSSYRVVMAV